MIIIAPRIDLNSERWIEPIEGLRLKVGSVDNHHYRSRNALVRRHIEKLDATYKVGTKDFDLSSVGDIDSVDDLLIENCAHYLLKGWEGVGESVDGKEVAIDYTPEKGVALLKQRPELYWQILATAAEIAEGKAEQTKDTVKKSQKRNAG